MIAIRTLLAIQILSIYLFSKTSGLLYHDDRLTYCNDLMSSGSNDSMIVEMGIYIYCLPMLLSLIFKERVIFYSLIMVYILQLGSYLLIEVCSIPDTVLFGRNIPLLLLLFIPPVSIYLLKKRMKLTTDKGL